MRADAGIKPDRFVEVLYCAIIPLHSRVDETAIVERNGVVAIEPDGPVKILDGEILVPSRGQISVEVPLCLLPLGDGPVNEGHCVFGIESDRLVEVLDRTVDPAFAQVGKGPVIESERVFRIEPDRFVVVVDGAIVVPVAEVDVAPIGERGNYPLTGLPAGLDHRSAAGELLLGRYPFPRETSAPVIGLLGTRRGR